jgi:hypothetical protein
LRKYCASLDLQLAHLLRSRNIPLVCRVEVQLFALVIDTSGWELFSFVARLLQLILIGVFCGHPGEAGLYSKRRIDKSPGLTGETRPPGIEIN